MTTEATTSDPQGATPNGPDPMTATVTTPVTGEMPGTTTPQSDDVQKELQSLRDALKKANAEAASHRHKAKELDDLRAQQEAEKLSETEKLQKQLAKLQTEHENAVKELQQTRLTHAVSSVAQRLGFADPNDAKLYIDQSQLNEDLSNAEDLLKAVLKSKPYLAGKPAVTTSGGATNPPRQTNSSGEITEQYAMDVLAGKIKELSQQEILRVNEWVVQQQFGSFNRRVH